MIFFFLQGTFPKLSTILPSWDPLLPKLSGSPSERLLDVAVHRLEVQLEVVRSAEHLHTDGAQRLPLVAAHVKRH